eukprot:1322640-Amphidinium_carterae.1
MNSVVIGAAKSANVALIDANPSAMIRSHSSMHHVRRLRLITGLSSWRLMSMLSTIHPTLRVRVSDQMKDRPK